MADPDARKTHLADQIGASSRHIAKILGEYRDELINQGFQLDDVRDMVERLEFRLFADTEYADSIDDVADLFFPDADDLIDGE